MGRKLQSHVLLLVRPPEKGKSMSEIKIPEGMLNAVIIAIGSASDSWSRRCCTTAAEAVLRWLSENPIVPTCEQIVDMDKRHGRNTFIIRGDGGESFRDDIAEWQRRMFLAPDPEILEEIKDLLYDPKDGPTKTGRNEAIIEAYRRGKASR
jgi:hypothetical protein